MSTENLSTRRVFLDTQVFRKNAFNFNSNVLQLLKERAVAQRAELFITDVVDREVRSRIRREVEEARRIHNLIRTDAPILMAAKGNAFFNLPKKLDVDQTVAALENAFDEFIDSADIETISCSAVSCGKILQDYFDVTPPFGKTEEKRKEFPDAISLEAIFQNVPEGESIFVISGDKGIKEACKARPKLIHLGTVEEFLELELAHFEDVTWIDDVLANQEKEIIECISAEVEGTYFYLDDEDGEVGEVKVDSIIINDTALINADEEEVEVVVKCTVELSADISYDDPNMTTYSEGEKYSFGTIEERVQRTIVETFSLTAYLDRKDREISDFNCSGKNSFSFSVYEYDEDLK